jgi:hypothetical protein
MKQFDSPRPGVGPAAHVTAAAAAARWHRHVSPALLVIGLSTSAWATALPIDEVLATLQAQGAKATLERHFDCNSESAAYAAVATGQPRWLDLALRLLPEADACYGEGLHDALGRAMRAAPRRVLPLVGSSTRLTPEQICLPFISAELPQARQLDRLRASRQAIAAVHDKALSSSRRACLSFIDLLERRIRQAPTS